MTTSVDILGASILVVDDSADNAMLLVEALHLFGYTNVMQTTDPRNVCALHTDNDFDLILLDMHMPRVNGLEVMRQLKEIERGRYLPVLAMTGDGDLKLAALQAGARDFIMKPFDFLELEARVRNILEVRLLYKAIEEQSRIQRDLAMHDALTGLPNRRLLLDRAAKMLQHARRAKRHVVVMYLDLDGFKQVNDVLGHASGDELLKIVAERLQRAVRQEDTVSRLGGDEFVLLLSDILDTNALENLAFKVLDYMATPFTIKGKPVTVSASIGIALSTGDAHYDVPEALIDRADQALYQAKREGKNRFSISRQPVMLA